MENKYSLLIDIIELFTTIGLGIITVCVAVKAIKQTKEQIEISNKQTLFDKRFYVYSTMLNLINEYSARMKDERDFSKPTYALDMEFMLFTENTFLIDISDVMFNTNDLEKTREFKAKIRELNALSTRAKLIFQDYENNMFSLFLESYSELLTSIFVYCKGIARMNEYIDNVYDSKEKRMELEIEKYLEIHNEMDKRMKVKENYAKTDAVVNSILRNNDLDKIASQIRLS